jgi:hypothetical protein
VDAGTPDGGPVPNQKELICRDFVKPPDGLEPSTPSLPSLRPKPQRYVRPVRLSFVGAAVAQKRGQRRDLALRPTVFLAELNDCPAGRRVEVAPAAAVENGRDE